MVFGIPAGTMLLVLAAVAVAGLVVGTLWIIRIARGDDDENAGGWRYRNH